MLPGGRGPALSPDGRWLAYWATESGENAVYVRSFSAASDTWRVSAAGFSAEPIWSRGGPELFYRVELGSGEMQLTTVPYTVDGPAFHPQAPRPWSPATFANRPLQTPIDVHPDGNRIVMACRDRSTGHVTLVLDVFDELRQLLPRRHDDRAVLADGGTGCGPRPD